MILRIDTVRGTVAREDAGDGREIAFSDATAFEWVSEAWLRCGWDARYVYSFTWLGRPVIQLPEDLLRIQEVIHRVEPHVIVETGVAHGGSLVFYASILKAMGAGRVIGVDIEIRPHNRAAITSHPLASQIKLIEGDSKNPATVERVRALVKPGERVLVTLDSKHTREHVLGELEAYGPLVSEGSYIVAMDGIMASLVGAPRAHTEWSWDNPLSAIDAFLARHPEFRREEPAFLFNEGNVRQRVTYWPGAFLLRLP